MKPLVLTMTAFGPYKDKETIDFTELEDNRLFVIAGNTGAGKTTIFDGISFALYGEASGQDRDKSLMLRSDFADDDVHTSVELLFTIHGRTYRILRQLGHVKAGNKSKTGERYEFFERLESGDEIPCVDRQMVSEIDRKVEALIGLTQDQFKQIVMLPQGEFRKLLTSKTENKEEILRRLFKTDAYKQISERLRTRKEASEQAYNRKKQTFDHYVGTIEAVLPKREDSVLFEVVESEHMNVNHILSGFDEELLFYRDRIEADEKEYHAAYHAHNEKQAEWHQAKALNESFEDLAVKKDKLDTLNQQVPDYKIKERKLETAQRAGNIEPYEKQTEASRQTEKVKVNQLKNAETAKKNAEKAYENAEAHHKIEQEKQAERDEARRNLDKLKEYVPAVEAFRDIEKRLTSLHKTKEQVETELAQLQNKADAVKKETLVKKQTLDKIDSIPSLLSEKTIQLEKMREEARVLREFLTAQKNVEEFRRDVQTKQKSYEKAKKAYDQAETAWLNNHAELLATRLHDGEACPVCGSTSHPMKANTHSDGVTKQSLDNAKYELDREDQSYREAKAHLHTSESTLTTQSEAVRTYVDNLDKVKELYDDLVPRGQELKAQIQSLTNQDKQRTALKKEVETFEEQFNTLEKQLKEKEHAVQEAKTNVDKAKAVYEDRVTTIPEIYRDLEKLKQTVKQAERYKQQLESAWDQAQTQLQHAKQTFTQTETSYEHVQKQLLEAENNRKEHEKQFDEQLKQAGFTSQQAYQEAKMDAASIQTLKESIESFKQQRILLMEQTTELAKKLEGKRKKDITALEKEKETLKTAYETAFKMWKQSEDYYREAKNLQVQIEKAHEEVVAADRQLGRLTHLHDVIRGQNAQKVSFERYLQIEYLEQIIEAANERLRHLSNGQFYLIRSDRQEAHGRQSGLGLDIYDAYTGQNRDVKTLSGGEKFNASLCLALGMSDVIQSFQGGVSIETMFIDEGFGTLDEEALHKAIDTLIELQQSGRMIGVISHVQELKTIFPAVLEVKKTKEGSSRTAFLVK
ncbi:Nuclease SbcCD subunit [Lentibacillus sp. JNUCC-1]|uniref:AAA family ATPase n=1 Tax=Lentibacillus sp. JNUCC-1 TaxID=2654513 RepID=UPI0012E9630C|nr:SMC family ATPase [Lentibacillus sp. JNUCC-1]MUV36375.1 Nuclease SbcCD subunit [Lentibacillus sp. JNUCC-1]